MFTLIIVTKNLITLFNSLIVYSDNRRFRLRWWHWSSQRKSYDPHIKTFILQPV